MIPLRNTRRFVFKAIQQPGYALRVFLKRLKANVYYWAARGRSAMPEAITLFLTHRCNLHCKMCGQWGEGNITGKKSSQFMAEELPFERAKDLLDEVGVFRPNITLFGGEPLLCPHCTAVIKYIKQKKMHCLMITNGYLLEHLAGEIVDSGLDELNISLDGDKELHDQIRGMPGLFEQIMRGIKQLNRHKEKKNTQKPLLNLQCTISKYNYTYLDRLLGVAGEAQADTLTFHNLIFTNARIVDNQKEYDQTLAASSRDWEGFIFNPGINPQILSAKMRDILSGRHSFKVDFYPNFNDEELQGYYQDNCGEPFSYAGRCLSPWIAAYIFPDLEVRPCLNSTYSFGNLKENRFLDIWNSAKAIKFRLLLKEKRIFPVCLKCTELYRY